MNILAIKLHFQFRGVEHEETGTGITILWQSYFKSQFFLTMASKQRKEV